MYCLSIQVLPACFSTFNRTRFLQILKAVNRTPEIDHYQERQQEFLHYNFFTEQPVALWQSLQEVLLKNADNAAQFLPSIIIICEPLAQPDATLLLHHPDPQEKNDRLQ
jgi:hypothetical protein